MIIYNIVQAVQSKNYFGKFMKNKGVIELKIED
jgi:hypothetical protein